MSERRNASGARAGRGVPLQVREGAQQAGEERQRFEVDLAGVLDAEGIDREEEAGQGIEECEGEHGQRPCDHREMPRGDVPAPGLGGGDGREARQVIIRQAVERRLGEQHHAVEDLLQRRVFVGVLAPGEHLEIAAAHGRGVFHRGGEIDRLIVVDIQALRGIQAQAGREQDDDEYREDVWRAFRHGCSARYMRRSWKWKVSISVTNWATPSANRMCGRSRRCGSSS